jgi:hypothetical protein
MDARHEQLDAEESEEMDVEGESGIGPIGAKAAGCGNGNGMAVASETVEKSGQGLDVGKTGRFGCFKRSGRQVWLWSSRPDSRSTGWDWGEFSLPGRQYSTGHRWSESGKAPVVGVIPVENCCKLSGLSQMSAPECAAKSTPSSSARDLFLGGRPICF